MTLAARTGSSKAREREPTSDPYRRPPGSHTPNARYALDWGMQAVNRLRSWRIDRDLGAFVRVFLPAGSTSAIVAPLSLRGISFSLGLAKDSDLKRSQALSILYRQRFAACCATWTRDRPRRVLRDSRLIRFTGFGNDTEVPEFVLLLQGGTQSFRFRARLRVSTGGQPAGDASWGYGTAALGSSHQSWGRSSSTLTRHLASNQRQISSVRSGTLGVRHGFLRSSRSTGSKSGTTRETIPRIPTRGFPGPRLPEPFIRVRLGCGIGLWQRRWERCSTYLTARIPTNSDPCLKSGWQEGVGDLPLLQESAFLGRVQVLAVVGTSSGHLRGFRKDRFAGDASLYANAELRLRARPPSSF